MNAVDLAVRGGNKPHRVRIHSEEDFASMRRAGRLAAETLDFITPYVKPGITTHDLDQLCHTFIRDHDAVPAPLNYKGFPKSICTSVNHVVCHGIPGPKRLQDGDIINIDVTVILDSWHGDTSRMFLIGQTVGVKERKLVNATYDAMMRGIAAVRPGATVGDIGHAIQSSVEGLRQSNGLRYSVVRDFRGHGLGQIFHDAPSIAHFFVPPKNQEPTRWRSTRKHKKEEDQMPPEDQDLTLETGMFFTVEPMINAGGKDVKILGDGWTAVTKDGKPSAQFEHSVGVTQDGVEIFTLSPRGWHKPPYD